MATISACPHCGQQVSIPQQLFGSMVSWPMCGGRFTAGGTPAAAVVATSLRPVEPHRGELTLTLGILSLVVCGFLGPVAWVMGSNDLAKMRRGTMDKDGWGATLTGYILGIIGTIITIVSIPFVCLFLVALVS